MKQREFAIILVPAFILTVLWVLFNVYHNYFTSTIQDPLTYQIIPIEGKFDINTINEVKQRKRVNPSNEIIIVNTDNLTPTPAPDLTSEEATDSAGIDSEEIAEDGNE